MLLGMAMALDIGFSSSEICAALLRSRLLASGISLLRGRGMSFRLLPERCKYSSLRAVVLPLNLRCRPLCSLCFDVEVL